MYKQYLIFGSIAKDEIIFIPGNFEDFLDTSNPSKLNFSFMVEHISLQLGGIATNISYSLANLVEKPVYILGGVGSQDYQPFSELFSKNNILTDYLIKDNKLLSGTYKAITAKNNNQIGGFYYGANESSVQINLSEIPDIDNSLLTLSANEPSAFYEIQDQAINLGLDYVYDPGMALSWIEPEKLKLGCLNAKYVIVNDNEDIQLRKMTRLSIDDMNVSGASYIITKGGDGLEYHGTDDTFSVGALPDLEVVDPTAAGDSFRAGFIGGLEQGMETKEALAFGSALASICLQSPGGIDHSFDISEINNRKLKILN